MRKHCRQDNYILAHSMLYRNITCNPYLIRYGFVVRYRTFQITTPRLKDNNMAYREHTQPILESSTDTAEDFEFDLDESIEHIAHWLPSQGPIKDFIHHNTLHAVQHYPFHDGVAVAAKIFGARSYLPLEDYQNRYRQGRITNDAINWAIEHSGCAQQEYVKLRETLFEQDDTGHYPPVSLANHGIRNSWLTQLEVDLNSLAHPILFRLLGNFLDQGISRWSLPKKRRTFLGLRIALGAEQFIAALSFK